MNDTGTRVALVTGANRGLGLETSRQLLAQGLKVVLSGRDEDALDRAAATLGSRGDRVMTVRMDVVDVGSIKAAQAAVERGFGRVDVLVNNAAVLIAEHGEVLSIPSEAYRRTFETNVFGVIEVCRAFAPAMARAGYGRIVNVSSGAGQLATMSTVRACILDVQNGPERVHTDSGPHLPGEGRAGQCRRPRLGPNGHGWPFRPPIAP